MEKSAQLPTLKLADNIPVKVQFDGVNGKEIENEQYGTTSYMYIVYDLADEEKKKVWFATEKQQEKLLEYKVQPGKVYSLMKEKLSEDKYTKFIVTEVSAAKPNESQLNSETRNEQAVKTEGNTRVSQKVTSEKSAFQEPIPPEAAAWAIKMAVLSYDYFARGHLLSPGGSLENEIEDIARKFLTIQQKLTGK